MKVHDLLGVGIGPFNLGLACLSDPLPDLDAVFLDSRPGFSWHPGAMIEGSTIQVPFLADLVSLADPTSRFSFLNHLKLTGRLYRFYIRENFLPLRAEYDAYCRWACGKLTTLRFGRHVQQVTWDAAEGVYVVRARSAAGAGETYRARRLVLGIGTAPHIPDAAAGLPSHAVHSADYLAHRDRLRGCRSVTVVGSGQSAAEIYLDLLRGAREGGYRVDWVTRSPRFFPMEYTKLTLELTSPEYVTYFHALPAPRREKLLREQRSLYKGISAELVNEIFDTLYQLDVAGPVPTSLAAGTEVRGARWDDERGAFRLTLHHGEQGATWEHETEGLVLATGYAARVPTMLDGVRDRVRWDADGRLDVARDYSVDRHGGEIFVQNGEEHTHGLAAPDLGMGAYRNSVILARVLGREVYPVERSIAFQHFGAPGADVAGQVRA